VHLGPASLADATTALRDETTAPVGGGSDLLGMIKDDLAAPDRLVRLTELPGLDTVAVQPGGAVRIGGMITLSALGRHAVIRARYTVLAEAAGSVGTPQIRNAGTLAGNITQRPWCWYFRQGFPCFKHGGTRCFSRTGENQFNAILGGGPSYIVHPSDMAPALVALDARVHIVGDTTDRWLPIREFFVRPDEDVSRENVLQPGEIVTEVELPPHAGARSVYTKVTDREAWTHAVVSAAVVLTLDDTNDGICLSAGVALGGVAPIPWRVEPVERLLVGERITPELAAAAGAASVEGARALARNQYKVPLVEETLRRTLLSLA
jgi:xanthine dehydrogenase YagS FAD-binding subunit